MSDLRTQRDRFLAFSFANADLLIEVDRDHVILFAAGAARVLIGVEPSALVGRGLLDIVARSDRDMVRFLLARLTPGVRIDPIQVHLRLADGEDRPIMLGGCCMPQHPDRLHLTLAPVRSHYIDPASLAERDDVTGLIQRDGFVTAVSDVVERSAKAQEEVEFSLLQATGWPQFADTAENEAVSSTLREMGTFLRANAAGQTACQIAEGKFGILHDRSVTNDNLTEGLTSIARARGKAGAGLKVVGKSIDISQSLSRAEFGRALAYAINRFVEQNAQDFDITSLSGALDAMVGQTAGQMQQIRQMVAADELMVKFQPIVHLQTRETHHYEMLVRFDEAESPHDMIRLAEQTNIIQEIDTAMVGKAVRILQEHQGALSIAVNVSAQSLKNDLFVAQLGKLLGANRPLLDHLLFEVTESSEITDLDKANAVIQDLRKFGCAVCLDDFGAGSASFQYLHALHVDYIKIDGRYVRQLAETERERHMLRAMVGLCSALNVRTVAEMVESKEQVAILYELGVDFGQGFYFGKPGELPDIVGRKAAAPTRRRGVEITWT